MTKTVGNPYLDDSKMKDALDTHAVTKDKEIRTQLKRYVKLSDIFGSVSILSGKMVMTERMIGELTQPFQEGWHTKGGLIFEPRIRYVEHGKVNDKISPFALRDSYLSEDLGITNEVKLGMQLAKMYFGDLVEKVGEEIDECLINGVKKPITDTSKAGDALDVCDGLKEVTKQAVEKQEIAQIAVSEAITSDNAGDILRAMWLKIPEKKQKRANLKCYVFSDVMEKYKDWYEATRGIMTNFDGIKFKIPKTECEIIELPYGNGSNMILFTFEKNIKIAKFKDNDTERTNVYLHEDMFSVSMHYTTGIEYTITGKADNPLRQFVWINSNCDFIKGVTAKFTFNTPEVLSSTAVKLSGTLEFDTLSGTGFEFKKESDTEWTAIPVKAEDSMIYKQIEGLEKATKYDVRMYCQAKGAAATYSTAQQFTTNAE